MVKKRIYAVVSYPNSLWNEGVTDKIVIDFIENMGYTWLGSSSAFGRREIDVGYFPDTKNSDMKDADIFKSAILERFDFVTEVNFIE